MRLIISFILAYLVQQHQNERALIFYNGNSPRNNKELAKNIPGLKPLADLEAASITLKPGSSEQHTPPAPVTPNLPATDDCVGILDDVHSKLQPFIEQVMILGKY